MDVIYQAGANCFENSMYTMLNYYKREYQLLFGNVYTIKIVNSLDNYSNLTGVIEDKSKDIYNDIQKYYGALVNDVKFDRVIDSERILNELCDNKPMVVWVDTYYCHHLKKQFNKYHNRHAFVAYLYKDNQVYFVDPNIGSRVFTMEKEEFLKALDIICIFELNNLKEINYKNHLRDSIEYIRQEYDVNSILLLKDIFDLPELILKEFSNYSVNEYDIVPFIIKLSNIGGRRNLYATYLEYISNKVKCYDVRKISDDLRYCASKWCLLRSLLLKHVMKVDLNENITIMLKSKVNEIYDIEEKCLKELVDVTREKSPITYGNDCIIDKRKIKQYIYLDMKNYYNNKGLVRNETLYADLTLRGQFFCDKNIPFKKIITNNYMSFKFPDLALQYDNIICRAQEINIPEDFYAGIMFLGCSENGCFWEYGNIIDRNSNKIELKMAFTSWIKDKPIYNDMIFSSYYSYDKYDQKKSLSKRNIYAICCELDDKKLYQKLILPNCDNMHIFAITLFKVA